MGVLPRSAWTTCAIAYGACIPAVAVLQRWLPPQLADVSDDPIAFAALADVVCTLVVFLCSVLWNNSSVYDPYWSVAPAAM